MVAAVQIESSDDEVQHILREHPEILPFIRRVSEEGARTFPGGQVRLEPATYEDDTPLMLVIRVYDPGFDFSQALLEFGSWLGKQSDYDFDLISVVPVPYRTAQSRST